MTAIAEKTQNASVVVPFRSTKERERITPAKLGIQTLISSGTTFIGDLESNGGMKIDGNITGNVTVQSETDAWVVVSEAASVDGNIAARVIAVCGRVKGSIKAKHIVLMPSAMIDGDIQYEILHISEGACVSGRLNRVSLEAAGA